MTPEQLFSDLLAAQPSRPFVTYYDEQSGERTELSVRSLANWVAKTHLLLLDDLGLGVGDAAFVDVPAHWLSVPVILGCLTAGLELTDDASGAAVGFVDSSPVDVPDLYAIRPRNGATDFATAVRPMPDAWSAVQLSASDDDPCFAGRTRGELVSIARGRAADLGVASGSRVLTTRTWQRNDDVLDTLFVPLVAGGSIVLVANAPDDEVVERRMQQERATVRI